MNPLQSLKRARARSQERHAAEREAEISAAKAREQAQQHAQRDLEHAAYALLLDRATLRRNPERAATMDERRPLHDFRVRDSEAKEMAKEMTRDEVERERLALEPALEAYYQRYRDAQAAEEARKDANYLKCVKAYRSRPPFEPTPAAITEELSVLGELEDLSRTCSSAQGALDINAEREHLDALTHSPRALELRKRELLIKTLGLGDLDPETVNPVVDAAIKDEVLVKLDAPASGPFYFFEVLPCVLRIPVLLLPLARTQDRRTRRVVDVIPLGGITDADLEAALVLFEGTAFPTFALAVTAAQAF